VIRRRKAKVERLFPGAGPVVVPDREIIETLSDLTRRARRGEIKGIGIFWVDGGNTVTTAWVSGCADGHFMVSGAARLAHRIVSAAGLRE